MAMGKMIAEIGDGLKAQTEMLLLVKQYQRLSHPWKNAVKEV